MESEIKEFFGKTWNQTEVDDHVVDRLKAARNVIDVGCGFNPYKKHTNNLVGVDIVNGSADWIGDIIDYKPVTKFDVAICYGILHFNSYDWIRERLEWVVNNLTEDGEILIKGENVMLGYWNKKKETSEIIRNGWLYTGDIGEIDTDGFLKITDRKKDLIVNFGGDNISPTKIENFLCLNNNIKQSFVYGDKKNYLVALLVVEKNFTTQDLIAEYIDNLNEKLSSIEKIKKYFIISNEFTIENKMLTPTLKLRRKEIVRMYFNQIENLYQT